jgi:hypothetical protein
MIKSMRKGEGEERMYVIGGIARGKTTITKTKAYAHG